MIPIIRLFLYASFLLLPVTAFAQGRCLETGGYPFVEGGCVHMRDLDTAMSGHASNAPPVNNQGEGAYYGYIWLDTSTTPTSVRLCNKQPFCSATYLSTEWALLGSVDSILGWIANFGSSGTEGTLASAATTNLGSLPNKYITITGTTSISSFGTSANVGDEKILTFTGSLTLFNNSVSLQLPGSANLAVSPGDTASAKFLGSGNWKLLWYTRAIDPTLPEATLASGTTVDLGTVPNHNITITGGLSISSFGSSAAIGDIRILTFSGTPTLVQNSVSLQLPGTASILVSPGDTAAAKFLGTGNWKILWYTRAISPDTTEATIASASVTDLGSTPSTNITITGAATITSLGSSAPVGTEKIVTFNSTPTLTYNATSLILPGNTNITAGAGDTAAFKYLGGGNWRALWYTRQVGGATFPVPISINPPVNSFVQGIHITQSGPTTGSYAGPINYNEIDVTHESTTIGPDFVATGLRLNFYVGGAALGGQPMIGGYFNVWETISGNVTSADKIGLVGSAYLNQSDPTSGIYGLNSVSTIASGGVAARAVGFEADIDVRTGGSTSYRYALSAVNLGVGVGSTLDAGLVFGNIGAASGAFQNMIVLSNSFGNAPLATNGSIFASDAAQTVGSVLNFPSLTVTANILNFPNAVLSGTGELRLSNNIIVKGGPLTAITTGQGVLFASANSGAILQGFGATSDINVNNKNGTNVCAVPTGSTLWNCAAMQSSAGFYAIGNPAFTAATGNATFGASVSLGAVVRGMGSTNDWTVQNSAGTTVCANATGTTLFTCSGQITAGTGFLATGSPSNPTTGQAAFGSLAVHGAYIQGFGSTNDFILFNKFGSTVCANATGTTLWTCAGEITAASGFLATGFSTPGAGQGMLGATALNGAVVQGSGSSNDVLLANKNGSGVCWIVTGSTLFTCAGEVTAASGFLATGFTTPGASGQGMYGSTAANGAVIQGFGSTFDFVLNNKNGTNLCWISTGTLNFTCGNILANVSFQAVPNVPTLSACGTSPVVTAQSSNNGGRIQPGTGGITSCTVTYATPFPTNAFPTVTAVGFNQLIWLDSADRFGFTVTSSVSISGAPITYNVMGN